MGSISLPEHIPIYVSPFLARQLFERRGSSNAHTTLENSLGKAAADSELKTRLSTDLWWESPSPSPILDSVCRHKMTWVNARLRRFIHLWKQLVQLVTSNRDRRGLDVLLNPRIVCVFSAHFLRSTNTR